MPNPSSTVTDGWQVLWSAAGTPARWSRSVRVFRVRQYEHAAAHARVDDQTHAAPPRKAGGPRHRASRHARFRHVRDCAQWRPRPARRSSSPCRQSQRPARSAEVDEPNQFVEKIRGTGATSAGGEAQMVHQRDFSRRALGHRQQHGFRDGFRDGAREPEFGRRRDGMRQRTSRGIPRHAKVKAS
ncbi:hypothetical protein AWB82_04170 [Caballeronia glebae]|uniref:Uncharacterized protein n=1 Tax=Caballeronia glebae TaxID=1777143 RepID=A0A158BL95_9BURK|nr:hypothetical protein AWB82_04170 [Caballeronia glebae]